MIFSPRSLPLRSRGLHREIGFVIMIMMASSTIAVAGGEGEQHSSRTPLACFEFIYTARRGPDQPPPVPRPAPHRHRDPSLGHGLVSRHPRSIGSHWIVPLVFARREGDPERDFPLPLALEGVVWRVAPVGSRVGTRLTAASQIDAFHTGV